MSANATQYTLGTVRRAVTIVSNVDRETLDAVIAELSAPKPQPVKPTTIARTATRTRKPVATKVLDWRERVPSDKQMRRINNAERTLGYRLSTKATVGTAGAASDLYQSLKAEINS